MVKMFYDRGPGVWVLQWADKRQHFSSRDIALTAGQIYREVQSPSMNSIYSGRHTSTGLLGSKTPRFMMVFTGGSVPIVERFGKGLIFPTVEQRFNND